MIKSIIGIILLLFGASLVYFFGLPAFNSIAELRSQSEVLVTVIERTESLNQSVANLFANYQTISSNDISSLDILVPNQIDNVKLILEIQQLAEKYGLAVQTIDVSSLGDNRLAEQNINSVSFSADVAGFYDDFVDFLIALERSQRLIDINSVSFSAKDSEEGYRYSLSVTTYWQET